MTVGGQEAELSSLSVRELRKHAEATGVDAEALEDARDSENPKDAILQLLLARGAAAGGGTPPAHAR